LDDNITHEQWKKFNDKWQTEKDRLYIQLEEINKLDKQFYQQADTMLRFTDNAYNLYLQGSLEQRRKIIEIISEKIICNFTHGLIMFYKWCDIFGQLSIICQLKRNLSDTKRNGFQKFKNSGEIVPFCAGHISERKIICINLNYINYLKYQSVQS